MGRKRLKSDCIILEAPKAPNSSSGTNFIICLKL